MNTHTFYSDPGHAWLEVPMEELETLGIARKISRYSYHKDGLAYLEEDQDAYVYIQARKLAGKCELEFKFTESNSLSPIRGYDRFTEKEISL